MEAKSRPPIDGSFAQPEFAKPGNAVFVEQRRAEADISYVRDELCRSREEIRLGHRKEVLPVVETVISSLKQRHAMQPNDATTRLLLAEALALRGTIFHKDANEDEAQRDLMNAVELFRQVDPPAVERAQFFGDYGVALFLLHREQEAFEILERAWKEKTAVPLVSKCLGVLLEKRGELATAEPLLVEAHRQDVNDADLLRLLARAQQRLNKLQDAARSWCDLGYLLGGRGKYQEAEQHFEQSLMLDPDYPPALFGAGESNRLLGKFGLALLFFERFLAQNGDHLRAWVQKSYTCLSLERFAQALEAANQAIRIDASDDSAILAKSYALENLNKTEEAEQCISAALGSTPASVDLLIRERDLLVKLGRHEEFLNILDRALEQHPDPPTSAIIIGSKGEALRQLGRPAEAIPFLAQAIQLDATQGWFYFALANSHYDAGNLQSGLEFNRAGLARDPENVRGWLQNADYLEQLARFDEALVSLDRVLAIAPDDVAAIVKKAKFLRKRKRDHKSAVELLDTAIAKDPSNYEAWYEKGCSLITLSAKDAVTALQEAIALRPNSADAHFQLGDAYRTLGDYPEALKELDEALRLDENHWPAMGTKGQVFIEQSQWEEGVDLLNRALQGNPDLDWAFASFGTGLWMLGRDAEALQALDKALKYRPDDVRVLSDKAWVLMDLQRVEESIGILSKLIDKEPDSDYLQAQYGQACQMAGKWEESLKALDRSLELNESSAFAQALRARLLGQMAEFQEGVKSAKRAVELDSTQAWVYSWLGWCYENDGEGHWEEARQAYEKAEQLAPGELGHLKGIANNLRLSGRKQEATQRFNAIIQAAQSQTTSADAYSAALLGWCNYCLSNYEEAIRLFLSSIASQTGPPSDQYDLGLCLTCAARYSDGRDAYRKGVEESRQKRHVWERRGLLKVALTDLIFSLNDPEMVNADSSVPEIAEIFYYLRNALNEALRSAPRPRPEEALELPPSKSPPQTGQLATATRSSS